MRTDMMIDAFKEAFAKVLPGAAGLLAGTMLALGLGVTWLVEGPFLIRALTADMAQPFRSLLLFVGLAAPLVVLCCALKLVVGYTISLTTKPKRRD